MRIVGITSVTPRNNNAGARKIAGRNLDGMRRRIAQYLQTLLVDESVEATNAEAGAHAASRTALSAASTSPTNASSIVGDGRSALATRAFSASGEPSAITFA